MSETSGQEEPKKYRVTTDLGGDLIALSLIMVWMFWLQSGWYRVDCALGINKACELIASEKDYVKPSKAQPSPNKEGE